MPPLWVDVSLGLLTADLLYVHWPIRAYDREKRYVDFEDAPWNRR